MARLATRLMLGETIESLELKDKVIPYYGAKEGRTLSRAYRVYFVNSQMYTASFAMQNQGSNRQVATFPGVDPILGPEMRSTGEVLGLAENFPLAFYKSQVESGPEKPQEAAGSELPHAPAVWENKKVLISLSNKEGQKEDVLKVGKTLSDLGFTLIGTQGTADFYNANGIKCDVVNKMNNKKEILVDVVGKCCESGDIIQENVQLPSNIKRGDLICVLTTGAYNYSMSSNYNRLPRPAVVMVSEGKAHLSVRRETYEDLIAREL